MFNINRQLCTSCARFVLSDSSLIQQPVRQLYAKTTYQFPKNRRLFSSNPALQEELISGKTKTPSDESTSPPKRKTNRATPTKTSLRRVAVEAQRSRENTLRPSRKIANDQGSNTVTAVSVADRFDMDEVARILRSHGFPIDPDSTGFELEQVIHTRGVNNGDIFVFPSGSLVAWSLPEDVVSDLATKTLLPAARNPHMDQMEMEDLEYSEVGNRDSSSIKGDVITLGTKTGSQKDENST